MLTDWGHYSEGFFYSHEWQMDGSDITLIYVNLCPARHLPGHGRYATGGTARQQQAVLQGAN